MAIWQAELTTLMSALTYASAVLALLYLFRARGILVLGDRRGLLVALLAAAAGLQALLLFGLARGWAVAFVLAAAAGQLAVGIGLWVLLAGIKPQLAGAMGRGLRRQIDRANGLAAAACATLEMAEATARFGRWQVDRAGRVFEWSTAMYRIHGAAPATFLPSLDAVLASFHADDRQSLSNALLAALAEGGEFELRLRLCRADGEMRHVIMSGRSLMPGIVCGVLVDVTAGHQAEARLREATAAALHANTALRELTLEDDLTGLSNRRQFDLSLVHEFKRAVRSGLPLGLALIDIDNFRAYNAAYGSIAGDACLRRVAQAVKSIPRRTGDVVARHRGGQIAVLLPLADDKGAERVATVLLEAVRALQILHEGVDCGFLTVSCGVAAFTSLADVNNPQELVRRAGQARDKAKTEGRNRVVKFDLSLNGDLYDFHSPPQRLDMAYWIENRVS
ncbi:diguanylate cyclase [Acidocella sp.]|uniref:GGDEF domain-containing protein n=1 Tax=Acidocella sp. TaxID=50710 RepID=UPI0026047233|nr:sensor domain-containing diguanylate cyclase [Acidocella sp.]MDD2795231.1 sensor domain-containing diguanylate cyclase [Acidocella sp.]